jgi:hypothetical protein
VDAVGAVAGDVEVVAEEVAAVSAVVVMETALENATT